MSEEIKIRRGWLKFMYIFTLVTAGSVGLLMLIAPGFTRSLFGMPEQDPVTLGCYGSVLVACALLSVLGLRSPVKFAPILLMQLFYKPIWFVAVIIPLAATGRFPRYAVPLCVLFGAMIVGDLIAIPFRQVFSKESGEV